MIELFVRGLDHLPRLKAETTRGQVIPFMQDGALFYKKGIEAYEKHDMDQAIHYIERAIQMEPAEPVFQCQLSIFLAEQGEYVKANEELEKILTDVDPTMNECHFFMANNHAHLGNLAQAKHHLSKYLINEPEGEFTEDAQILQTFLDEEFLDNDDWEEMHRLSQLDHIFETLYEGEFEEAEELARQAIGRSPREWNAYAYLAEALIFQGELDEAALILQNLLSKEEPNFLAHCLYTILLVKTKDKEAEHWVKNIIGLHPIDEWHCYYLGKTLFYLGEYDKANDWYRKLYRQYDFKSWPLFLHQRAVLLCKLGKDEKATELWEEAMRLDQNKADIAQDFLALHKQNKLFTYSDELIFLYAKLGELEED